MSIAADIKLTLQEIEVDIQRIEDSVAKSVLTRLFNLIEDVTAENEQLKEDKQKLQDELNRLKGEQGKPEFKKKKISSDDISSDNDRKNAEGNKKKSKNDQRNREPKLPKIKIDREQICPLDLSELPADVVFKGYEDVIVQDIKIITDNVKYRREVYYSPSQKRTWQGPLPKEVEGEFGAGIRSLIPILKSECSMSESKIHGFFESFGIHISAAYISTLWTQRQDVFHREKDDIYRAGVESGTYQQIDDTGGKVNGINHYVQIVCNEHHTSYFTTERKDRLTVLDVLRNFAPRQFICNDNTLDLLTSFGLSEKAISTVDKQLEKNLCVDENTLNKQLDEMELGVKQRARVLEACAISAYQQQTDIPKITTLLSDDAPQFKLLIDAHGLCWVHDGRHYKKLKPFVPEHREKLEQFRCQYWEYYGKLHRYKKHPTPEEAQRLEAEFERLFSTATSYEQLDARIAKTLAKKTELLMVLRYPELPLHNNAAELGARVQARYRDVSLHTKSEAGTKAKDTFMTITQTAKKLGVNVYDYIHDRVSGSFQLPSLADLIRQKAACPNNPSCPSEV